MYKVKLDVAVEVNAGENRISAWITPDLVCGGAGQPRLGQALRVALLSVALMGSTLSQAHSSVLWLLLGLGGGCHSLLLRLIPVTALPEKPMSLIIDSRVESRVPSATGRSNDWPRHVIGKNFSKIFRLAGYHLRADNGQGCRSAVYAARNEQRARGAQCRLNRDCIIRYAIATRAEPPDVDGAAGCGALPSTRGRGGRRNHRSAVVRFRRGWVPGEYALPAVQGRVIASEQNDSVGASWDDGAEADH